MLAQSEVQLGRQLESTNQRLRPGGHLTRWPNTAYRRDYDNHRAALAGGRKEHLLQLRERYFSTRSKCVSLGIFSSRMPGFQPDVRQILLSATKKKQGIGILP